MQLFGKLPWFNKMKLLFVAFHVEDVDYEVMKIQSSNFLLLSLFLSFVAVACQGNAELTTPTTGKDLKDVSKPDLSVSKDLSSDSEQDRGFATDTRPDLTKRDIGPDLFQGTPNLKIVPWQGSKGAVSFTFDDASGTHLDKAIPVLDKHGLRGTFFVLCAAARGREADWKAVATQGNHELANHTENHTRPAELSDDADIRGCDTYIRDTLGAQVNTFAYPYGDVGEPYRAYATENYIASRTTRGGIVGLDSELSWPEIPTDAVGVSFGPLEDTFQSIADAETNGHWVNFMYHGINDNGGISTPEAEFDAAAEKTLEHDVWVDTFGRIATYVAATQAIDVGNPTIEEGVYNWNWEIHKGAESTVRLHVTIDGGVLRQGDDLVPFNETLKVYEVDPRAGNLTWRNH